MPALWGMLLLLAAAGCNQPRIIDAARALPAGAQEVPAPEGLAEVLMQGGVSQHWARGYNFDGTWEEAIAHSAQLAASSGYAEAPTPPVPNIDRIGLTNEDVYEFWMSPDGRCTFGLLNLKLIRSRDPNYPFKPDYVVFSTAGP